MFALICGTLGAQTDQSYSGPGILSRGSTNIGERSGKAVDLRYYFNATGVYDTGLTPVSVDSNGHLLNVGGLWGTEVGFGAYGVHSWRHTTLGLDYTGNYRYYNNNTFYNGTDQFLSLRLAHQFTRRVTIDLRGTAGSQSQALAYYAPDVYMVTGVPTNELFDNRAYFGNATVNLVYQKTARLSFSWGGQGFSVRRRSGALIGVNGYDGNSTVAYRVSRRQTIEAGYRYDHFDFTRGFGESNMHTAFLGYSVTLSRRWELRLEGGGIRTEVQGLQSFAVDPAISAITGVTTGVRAFYQLNYLPQEVVSLSGRFHYSSLQFSYNDSITPGNGIFLTSRAQYASGSYSYTGLRQWNLGLSGGYSKLRSIGQDLLGTYSYYSAGLGATYNLGRSFHFTARLDGRHTSLTGAGFKRNSYRAAVGIAFSPGEVPLSLW